MNDTQDSRNVEYVRVWQSGMKCLWYDGLRTPEQELAKALVARDMRCRVLHIVRNANGFAAMDGDASMEIALPWVRSKHKKVQNSNGCDLFDTLKEHHLKAVNTFHAAGSWTWQQHRQEKWFRHRLDDFTVPNTDQWGFIWTLTRQSIFLDVVTIAL